MHLYTEQHLTSVVTNLDFNFDNDDPGSYLELVVIQLDTPKMKNLKIILCFKYSYYLLQSYYYKLPWILKFSIMQV